MTITSTNHNPMNESRYARHRSIWKGTHNQIEKTIAALNGTSGVTVHEYLAKNLSAITSEEWGFSLHATRLAPKRGQALGRWSAPPIPRRLEQAVAESLRSDLRLLWHDFITVSGRRIGTSGGAGSGSGENDGYSGDSLLVMAFGPQSFDLIVSKYGFGRGRKRSHRFFQWQARSEGFEGVVSVDDYEDQESGLTFFVER